MYKATFPVSIPVVSWSLGSFFLRTEHPRVIPVLAFPLWLCYRSCSIRLAAQLTISLLPPSPDRPGNLFHYTHLSAPYRHIPTPTPSATSHTFTVHLFFAHLDN